MQGKKMLNKYLSGNILIGSRAWNCGKPTSDWDIVCTMDTLELLLEDEMLREIDAYPNGYELSTKLIDDGVENIEEEEWERGEHDNGGFGSDLMAIVVAQMSNGVKLNLFIYPNRKKWKAYKKLVRNVREFVDDAKRLPDFERSWWVDVFIEEQYMNNINKPSDKPYKFFTAHNEMLQMLAGYNAERTRRV
jgi:hypothetical protein